MERVRDVAVPGLPIRTTRVFLPSWEWAHGSVTGLDSLSLGIGMDLVYESSGREK